MWRAVARAVGRVDEGVAEALVLCDGDAAAGAFAEEGREGGEVQPKGKASLADGTTKCRVGVVRTNSGLNFINRNFP